MAPLNNRDVTEDHKEELHYGKAYAIVCTCSH